MEIKFLNKEISMKKEINILDRLAIDFVSILDKSKVEYVFVSGYVCILFGRSRASEDIDLIIERLSFTQFRKLWGNIYNDFICINSSDIKEAYNEYLSKNIALRFARKGGFVPNIKLKFPKIDLDHFTLKEKIKVVLNDNVIFISPLELQIAFKLYLGSEKDIEDAKHLYKIFKDKINLELLYDFNRKLKIVEVFDKYLR